jgi:hypothetical protein
MENNIQQNLWEQIRQFYQDRLGIEPSLVEIMADFEVLKLCASGSSNTTIAGFLNMDAELVSNIIDKHFGFMGWKIDLDINPIRLYKNGELHLDNDTTQKVCETFSCLERLLDEKWI